MERGTATRSGGRDHVEIGRPDAGHGTGGCVEVSHLPVGFRVSGRGTGPGELREVGSLPCAYAIPTPERAPLAFPSAEWGAFLGAVRHDEL